MNKNNKIKIKSLLRNSEIYSCLICDNVCAFSALEEGLPVIFHICFNCITLYESGLLVDKDLNFIRLIGGF